MSRASRLLMPRRRARIRLMGCGIAVRRVAERADVEESYTSKILAGERPVNTDKARRVVEAAEALSGLSWAELRAPLEMERAAAA